MGNREHLFTKEAVVVNDLGLHARSAAKIAELAKNAKSKVWLQKGPEKVDAKSILDMLTLGCEKGSTVQILVEDAADMAILNSIVMLVANGFGE